MTIESASASCLFHLEARVSRVRRVRHTDLGDDAAGLQGVRRDLIFSECKWLVVEKD